MPNWVYNAVSIYGNASDIAKLKSQLNQPFTVKHTNFNVETGKFEEKLTNYTNPVFAFWNIVKPTDMDAYYGPQPEVDLTKPITFSSDHWYDWNVRNWGTKWDVAVSEDEKYPETELMEENANNLIYRFNTAWSYPEPAVMKLAEQYPDLTFNLDYEEETGWGGEIEYRLGDRHVKQDYDSKCRECDANDTLDYCEDCENEVCSACGYGNEEAEENKCQTHMLQSDPTQQKENA